MKKKRWHDYLWIASAVYLALGFFNILFAWLGLACFMTPLAISIFKGDKSYCTKYCGRGQLFELLGGRLGLSRRKAPPRFLVSKWFRYGFLTFFMAMFFLMLYTTYLVFAGASLRETVTLLWVFKLPWHWAGASSIASPGIAQFAFGFYGVMLTSTVLGLVTMLLFKPRSWCVYCPMGTMTQGICKIKHRKEALMEHKARQIAELLKVLANENRLLILCELIRGPKTVSCLGEKLPDITQSALSQHLKLMKAHGILDFSKSGQNVTYFIGDHRMEAVISVLKKYYCGEGEDIG